MTTDADRGINDSAAEHIPLRLRHVQFFQARTPGERQDHGSNQYSFHFVASLPSYPLNVIASGMPRRHGQVCWVNMHTNNELREKNERWRGLSAASGEKDPAEHLLTVARRYSREIIKRHRLLINRLIQRQSWARIGSTFERCLSPFMFQALTVVRIPFNPGNASPSTPNDPLKGGCFLAGKRVFFGGILGLPPVVEA